MRPSLGLIVAAALLIGLSGCGKAGRPVAPAGSTYPLIYPNKNLSPDQKDGRALPPEWDQQDLDARFTPNGSYIDPSTRAVPMTPLTAPGSTSSSSDPFSKSLSTGSPSMLPPAVPSMPSSGQTTDEEPQP